MATILIVEDDRNMRLLTVASLADVYTTVALILEHDIIFKIIF